MRVHTFTAVTQKDAMQKVRETLGDEAIIISSSKENGGIKIIAAIEEDVFALPKITAKKEPVPTQRIADILRFHKLPEVISEKMIGLLSGQKFAEEREALEFSLSKTFAFSPLKISPAKAIILFGMSGVGKTLAISKLAAEAVMSKNKLAIITTDIKRAGGVEHLSAFAKILQADLKIVHNPAELASAVRDAKGKITLIDSAGLNPYDNGEIEMLRGLIHNVDIEPILTMSAGGDVEEAVDICRQLHIIGSKKLLLTKTDSARRFGSVLTAAKILNLELTNFGNTANVGQNLEALTPKSLANLLLKPF